jgi:lysyl-tRNA synthetase, class I
LFKRITGTRHVGIEDIPSLMDEYDLYEDLYFGKLKETNESKMIKLRGIYEYVNHLNPPKNNSNHIPYRLLVQQTSLFEGKDQIDKVYERLQKYKLISEKSNDIIEKIQLAFNWSNDILANEDSHYISLDREQKKALTELVTTLRSFVNKEDNNMANNIQTLIYETSKKHGIEPKNFFRLLYQILINSERGPKLGNYLVDLGIDRTSEIIERYL